MMTIPSTTPNGFTAIEAVLRFFLSSVSNDLLPSTENNKHVITLDVGVDYFWAAKIIISLPPVFLLFSSVAHL